MTSSASSTDTLERLGHRTLFPRLERGQQALIRELAGIYAFSFQELRQLAEICRDLSMWNEGGLERWWREYARSRRPAASKAHFMAALHAHREELKRRPRRYPADGPEEGPRRRARRIRTERSERKIFGRCPVASEKTVCCNLYTIDAVQNCSFGCSYCSIQTFYRDSVVFDADLKTKLEAIALDPERRYHIGTGQASDSLVWGNRNGTLDALFHFARAHPNVLLELKTKSDNVAYLLEQEVPENIVCSWSLNTPAVIANEEHLTAPLERRLAAARRLADRGVAVAFHFHPMVCYEGWDRDYPELARALLDRFEAAEVRFVSFGSLTLIKPVIKKIRELGLPSRVLQMEFATDPHGKLTYPDHIKTGMFRTLHRSLRPWHGRVFMYLCMEKAEIWHRVFGRVYRDNREFERDLLDHALGPDPRREAGQMNGQD